MVGSRSNPDNNYVVNLKKPIRSFVQREGRITKGQQQALEELWPQYCLELAAGKIQIKAPTIMEIGFGMGDSLFTLAQEYPEINFIGIDVYRPGVGALLIQLVANNLKNVYIYCADAIEVLNQCIPNSSLDEILILFPDPWPKQRHHKRRLIQTEFIELIRRKLKPNGKLHIATDCENYAKHILKILEQVHGFEKTQPKTRPLTKFEQRGKKLGHKIWDFCFVKTQPLVH